MDLYNTLIKLIENISIEYIMQMLLMIINCLPRVNFSARSATDYPAIIHVGLLSITSLVLTFETFKREQPLPIS